MDEYIFLHLMDMSYIKLETNMKKIYNFRTKRTSYK